mmetsp:Transcript_12429/g.29379  ORF Transcript_12429/g.29379 Transcript_12429/m.29379 type:complete len:256 (+) Transcript_12429:1092-1859(+)
MPATRPLSRSMPPCPTASSAPTPTSTRSAPSPSASWRSRAAAPSPAPTTTARPSRAPPRTAAAPPSSTATPSPTPARSAATLPGSSAPELPRATPRARSNSSASSPRPIAPTSAPATRSLCARPSSLIPATISATRLRPMPRSRWTVAIPVRTPISMRSASTPAASPKSSRPARLRELTSLAMPFLPLILSSVLMGRTWSPSSNATRLAMLAPPVAPSPPLIGLPMEKLAICLKESPRIASSSALARKWRSAKPK